MNPVLAWHWQPDTCKLSVTTWVKIGRNAGNGRFTKVSTAKTVEDILK